MSCAGDTLPKHVLNRFRFLDSSTFIIANEEGIEKKIDIENGFKEIDFNYRPLFDEIDGVEWKRFHYYL
jgi:hypothetical protein